MKRFILFILSWIFCSILGLWCGAVLFKYSLNLQHTEPSINLLLRYWLYDGNLPFSMQFMLIITSVISLSISFIPLLTVLIIVIKPKRELHGSSRFASLYEIKKRNLLSPPKGNETLPDLLIGKLGNKYLRWWSNEFLFIAAPTRSGKGVGIVIPNCLHYRDSLVVYDPKLENFLITAGFRALHGQEVYLFNPSGRTPEHERNPNAPLVSHRWNPFTYIRRDSKYTYKDLSNMAAILLPKPIKDNGSGSAVFFIESARKLFVGLALYLIETEHERDLNDYKQRTTLTNLFKLTTPKNGQYLSEWLKEEIELRDKLPQTQLSPQCKTLLSEFANNNQKTGGDILASLTAPLGIFLDPVVEAVTSADDFYLDEVRKKRMTIYIGVVPTETDTFSRLTNLFFSQLIDTNVQQGLPENNPKLKYQCCLLLDEFTALGVIPAIQHGVSYIAGYALRLLIIIQAPSQVEAIYGRENMKTFFTNFACRIFFTPREQNDAEEYSKIIGYETHKTKSISKTQGNIKRSTNISDQRRAVMNPDELKLMPNTDCVINLNGLHAIYAKKIIYWQDKIFATRANLPLPHIPALDVHNHIRQHSSSPISKIQYVPEHLLAQTDVNDCHNSEEIKSCILQILLNDASQEYADDIKKSVLQVWDMHKKNLVERWKTESK